MLRRLKETTFAGFHKVKEAIKKPTYPANHQPAMKVPKGGSSCKTCKFLGRDEKTCASPDYRAYYGHNRLLQHYEEFCSDWYTPKPGLVQISKGAS